MIYINNKSNDPSFNHALEEYYLRETNASVFMLWQNEPTVLIGRHQNLALEVDLEFARKHDVKVVRRLSGGGTVYGDKHSMQYSFISEYKNGSEKLFEKFAEPVVDALKRLGLDARFTGRNDIVIGDKKVSGNAQYRRKNRIIHHGTILFDGNRELLQGCIRVRDIKFADKCVRSVAGRIGFIKDYTDMNISEFMQYIQAHIISYHQIRESRIPTAKEIEGAKKYLHHFKDLRFEQDKKTYAHYYAVKYPFGLLEYGVDLTEDNTIKDIVIAGDFFSRKNIEEYILKLKGLPISQLNQAGNIGDYIIGMNNELFLRDLKRTVDKEWY